MAEDFLVDFSADEVNSLLRKIQESSIFTAEEKQKLNDAINSSGVAYKALADGNGNNIPNTYQTKLSSAQLSAVDSGIDSPKVAQIESNKNDISLITPELIELVDNGAKNLINAPSGSGTRWTDITCNLPAGEYVLSFSELSTTWEAPTNNSIQVGFFTESYSSVTSNYVYIDLDAKVLKVTTLDTAKIIRVYASPTSVTGKTITYRDAMVCTEAAWNISQAYQPYCQHHHSNR
jgi:hypothetical protein